ncbi:hypothetical protein Psuf_076000 [Phytohabitans suffuscus]|uniref:Alcohol dehydrogenase-like N-terminal domain-containing protein n=1 Tax=Phytohabitans suffuscus TaxID=624315 RepID=A0A6F8YVW9_9ACTN|nr:alcohol dehydrogenase catalytic domain-containing protein [Phytohabitans suffuscus]BCB90287.1 hypothetical protein Psuf_076000 [Phytohabitans suffuscus]
MAEQVLAAVRTGPGTTELREYPMPDVPDDGALMKVEVAGICGTDVKMYAKPVVAGPVIMGHENVGVIAKAGRAFTERQGLVEGDRVFLEHYVPCRRCEWCHAGEYRHCLATDWRLNQDARRYGYTSAEHPYHLWGGFAGYLYLPWNAVLHKVPDGLSAELAGIVTRCRTASSGPCSTAASATTPLCSSRAPGSRAWPRRWRASRPAPRWSS